MSSKKLNTRIMKILIGVIVLFSALLCFRSEASDDDWSLLSMRAAYVDYKNFKEGGRDPLFWDSHPKEQIDLHIDSDVLRFFYWDSMVHSMTDENQFHVVGLNMRMGVRLSKYLDVGMEHYSQHILDTNYPYNRFPVLDSLTVKIYLYRREKSDNSLADLW